MKRRRPVKNKKLFAFTDFNLFKYLSLLLMVLFILSIPFVIKKSIFIKRIECTSQYGECPVEISNNINVVSGHDMKVAKDNLERILGQTNQINNYLIQFKIPNTLKVDINIKKPRYSIKNSQGIYFMIDKDGLVLDRLDKSSLPTIEDKTSDYSIGEVITDKNLWALRLIEKVAWLYTKNIGVVENNTMKVVLDEGITVYFPLEGDIDVLIGSLRLIFSRLNEGSQGIRMEDVREIDLRFKNVVLR